jgi:hypothetical protein
MLTQAPYLPSDSLQDLTYCSALNTAGNAFSILQFWGSDTLMVSAVSKSFTSNRRVERAV